MTYSVESDIPSSNDNLPALPFETWANHGFVSVDPAATLEAFLGDVAARQDFLPVAQFRYEPAESRDYSVNAHWALYVENYLEGFHIPFVHAGLNEIVDYAGYTSELFRFSSLQRAMAKLGELAFEPPEGSVDHGRRVAAYYWWVFPNLMLNFYPWGLSLNLVQPEGIDRTRVSFRSYVFDAAKRGQGAGGALDRVEMEDEIVVQAVQRGVRSRFYRGGRYSPTRERGVHHFHRLLCRFLAPGPIEP